MSMCHLEGLDHDYFVACTMRKDILVSVSDTLSETAITDPALRTQGIPMYVVFEHIVRDRRLLSM